MRLTLGNKRPERRCSALGPVLKEVSSLKQLDPSALERARAFIGSVGWTFAKTRARYNPHHYIIERVEGGPEFDHLVALIRSTPIRRWRGGRYHCLDHRVARLLAHTRGRRRAGS